MSAYRPTELRALLEKWGTDAKKGLSQNFLIDGNIVRNIVKAAGVKAGDRVLEIGPGPGALTEALLQSGAHVTAVEMDKIFAHELMRLQTPDERLTVIQSDVLELSLPDLLKEGKWKVVANLPYHISTPILTTLLPMTSLIDSVTVMVQKEFADRMVGKKGTSNYSHFTIFLQFYATAALAFIVNPNCFYPRPKVYSAVVHCTLHPPLINEDVDHFFQLTRTAFQHKRKMLRASLKEFVESNALCSALLSLGFNETARPEDLSIDDFVKLFSLLKDEKNKT